MCDPLSGWAQLQSAPYLEMWKMWSFEVQLCLLLSWEEHGTPSAVVSAQLLTDCGGSAAPAIGP